MTVPGKTWIYLLLFLHCFQHCTGHINMGRFEGRGNKHIQLAKVLNCKLLTIGEQLPTFPHKGPGFEPPTPEVGGKCLTTVPLWPPQGPQQRWLNFLYRCFHLKVAGPLQVNSKSRKGVTNQFKTLERSWEYLQCCCPPSLTSYWTQGGKPGKHWNLWSIEELVRGIHVPTPENQTLRRLQTVIEHQKFIETLFTFFSNLYAN